MLSRLFALTVRHRKVIMASQAALSAAYLLAGWRSASWSLAVWPWAAGVGAVACVLAWLAYRRYRPATLTTRTEVPAFAVARGPTPVYLCVAILSVFSVQAGGLVRSVWERGELWQLDLLPLFMLLAVMTMMFRVGWAPTGVQLRPDGILDRQAGGSLFVPWETLAPEYPVWSADATGHLQLAYRRQELVRRRGLVLLGPQLSGTDIDGRFLARAIHHYVAHPEHRPVIGTEHEYQRLRAVLGSQPV